MYVYMYLAIRVHQTICLGGEKSKDTALLYIQRGNPTFFSTVLPQISHREA